MALVQKSAPSGDDIDPTILEGYRLVFDRELAIEVRNTHLDSAEEAGGILETMRIKVFVMGDEAHPTQTCVELLCETDLFLYYIQEVDASVFTHLQGQQKLIMDYNEYHKFIIKIIMNCLQNPQVNMGVLYVEEGGARLDFIQNMEYKFVELLSIQFHVVSDEMLRRKIMYRYLEMKGMYQLEHQKMVDSLAIVKVKMPSLLLKLQKHAASLTAAAAKKSSGGASSVPVPLSPMGGVTSASLLTYGGSNGLGSPQTPSQAASSSS